MLTTLRYRLCALGPWPRRIAALACLAMAAATAVAGRAPARRPTPPDATVVVVAHDLGAGTTLQQRDLTVRHLPPTAAPPGAVADVSAVTGRRIAGPIRSGEAVTASRLVGRGLTDLLPDGQTALAVPVDDLHVAEFIHAGDHVDVVAAAGPDTSPSGSERNAPMSAAPDAHAVLVLAVLPVAADRADLGGNGTDDGAEIILAATSSVARALAAKRPNGPFTVLLCRS